MMGNYSVRPRCRLNGQSIMAQPTQKRVENVCDSFSIKRANHKKPSDVHFTVIKFRSFFIQIEYVYTYTAVRSNRFIGRKITTNRKVGTTSYAGLLKCLIWSNYNHQLSVKYTLGTKIKVCSQLNKRRKNRSESDKSFSTNPDCCTKQIA